MVNYLNQPSMPLTWTALLWRLALTALLLLLLAAAGATVFNSAANHPNSHARPALNVER